MAHIIAVANQKGGVGKTTTAVNLTASLAATRRRVLLVDLDPQGNATTGCGVDKNDLDKTLCEVFLDGIELEETIQECRFESLNFWAVPANGTLTTAEVELMKELGREYRLVKALSAIQDRFDYILMDCPPALNLLTVNGLTAAHGVLIPMQCEYYAMEGLSALLQTIQQIREHVNPQLRIEGILRTLYDPRNNLATDVSSQLIMHFKDKVFRTAIPRNVRLAEAPSYGQPVMVYDRTSRGALAYLALAGEMLRRQNPAMTVAAAG